MPNWCENVFTAKAKSYEELNQFIKKYCVMNKETRDLLLLDFNKIIPQPKTIDECPEKFRILSKEDAEKHCMFYDDGDSMKWFNWYDWRIEHWNTKWEPDPYCYNIDTDTIEVTLSFATAWDPPTPIIGKLIEDNPNIEICDKFFEGGNGYCGQIDSTMSSGNDIIYYDVINNFEEYKEFVLENEFIDEETFNECYQ